MDAGQAPDAAGFGATIRHEEALAVRLVELTDPVSPCRAPQQDPNEDGLRQLPVGLLRPRRDHLLPGHPA